MTPVNEPIRPPARRRPRRTRARQPATATIDWLGRAAIACRMLTWLLVAAALLTAMLVPAAARPAMTLALIAGVVAMFAGQR
jgi:hypothetical protein